MIEDARAAMLEHPAELAAGLQLWLQGDGDVEAEAAGSIVGETLLMWKAFLKSKFKEPGARE